LSASDSRAIETREYKHTVRRLTADVHKRYIQQDVETRCVAINCAGQLQHVPEWWNWQTRRTQNPIQPILEV
jgi:hypothetical protein